MQDLIDNVGASRRVTMLHLASDDRLAAGEDSIRALTEERDLIVRIHECEVEWQG